MLFCDVEFREGGNEVSVEFGRRDRLVFSQIPQSFLDVRLLHLVSTRLSIVSLQLTFLAIPLYPAPQRLVLAIEDVTSFSAVMRLFEVVPYGGLLVVLRPMWHFSLSREKK